MVGRPEGGLKRYTIWTNTPFHFRRHTLSLSPHISGGLLMGKRIIFTGGSGKAGRHAIPYP